MITGSEEYLRPLLEKIISESSASETEIPDDTDSMRKLLRSYMNVRMPYPIPPDILNIQDLYLQQRNRERGTVCTEGIPSVKVSLNSKNPYADRISLWQGDITTLDCGAIVNAANSEMLGCFQPCHACIDNCIHTYAGMQLRAECYRKMCELRSIYGKNYVQPTSVPMVTDAYNLPCGKVIHVVGPIVYGDLTKEHERLLAQCYSNVLDVCAENRIDSVAFCCISTGVFRFPNHRAAEIAVRTVSDWLGKNDSVKKIIFNVFLDRDREIYERLLC